MVEPFAEGPIKDVVGERERAECVVAVDSCGDDNAIVEEDVDLDDSARCARSQMMPRRAQFEHCGGCSSH